MLSLHSITLPYWAYLFFSKLNERVIWFVYPHASETSCGLNGSGSTTLWGAHHPNVLVRCYLTSFCFLINVFNLCFILELYDNLRFVIKNTVV